MNPQRQTVRTGSCRVETRRAQLLRSGVRNVPGMRKQQPVALEGLHSETEVVAELVAELVAEVEAEKVAE